MDEQVPHLEKLIPHRDRMMLLDEIVEIREEEYCTGIARAREDWPLSDGKAINPIVAIELVAQATAALSTWILRKGGEKASDGYVVGIKRASLSAMPIPIGTQLAIKVCKLLLRDGYGIFRGTVHDGPRLCGEIELQVYGKEERGAAGR